LRYDAVSERLQLLRPRQPDVRDVALREAHHPFHELSRESVVSVSSIGIGGGRGQPSEDVFPAADGGLELSPLRYSATPGNSSSFDRFPDLVLCPPVTSATCGVGRRLTTVRRSSPPDPCEPGPFMSVVRGVGISTSPCGRFSFDRSAPSAYIVSVPDAPRLARGVGSDEDALSTMWSAGCGSWKANPPCVIPELGQVSENSVDSQSEMTPHVLQDDESGS
jgi:hypothetical protein